MPIVLGLDISKNKPGMAVVDVDSNKILYYDSFDLKEQPINNSSMFMMDKVEELIKKYSVQIAIIEDSFMSANFATSKILTFFHGICGSILIKNNIPIKKIINTSVRAYYSAKDKKELFQIICLKYGLLNLDYKKDNDKTDAIAIAFNINNPKIKDYS